MNALTAREPAIIIGLIGGAIVAGIEVLGPELFPDLQAVAIQAVQAIVAVLVILAIRLKVFSPATYEADMDAALRDKPGTQDAPPSA